MLSVCGGPVLRSLALRSVTFSNRSGRAFCMLTAIMGKESTMWIHTLSYFAKVKGGVLCIRGATCML